MKELKAVSRWITIRGKFVTPKHRLYNYAEKTDDEKGKRYLYYFRHGGRECALEQFLNRFGMVGFDWECKEYPAFITGYDGERYFDNVYCETDEYGEKIRLWKEI